MHDDRPVSGTWPGPPNRRAVLTAGGRGGLGGFGSLYWPAYCGVVRRHRFTPNSFPRPAFQITRCPRLRCRACGLSIWQVIDVVLLLAALGCATWLAHVARSRNGLLLLTIACLLLVWLLSGRLRLRRSVRSRTWPWRRGTPVYAVPLAVVFFFALPLVFTLFFGRTFCAAVCPLGAIQELVAVRSVRVPGWLDQCTRSAGLHLPGAGGDLGGHRHRIHHLPLRSFRGFLPSLVATPTCWCSGVACC